MEDFSKTMADAKQISEMMGNFSSSQIGANENPMFSNMYNILNLMDIMKSFQNMGKPASDVASMPAADSLPNNIMALKTIAPYMGEHNKKNILIASKLMELMHFINHIETQVSSENLNYSVNNRNMLIAARPYIDKDKQDMIDLLVSVMDISEILAKLERMNRLNAKL